MLYVSHRLEEVVRVADRAVVLRDGAVAGELHRGEIEAGALVRLMIGGGRAGARRPRAPSGRSDDGGDGDAPFSALASCASRATRRR